MNHTSNDIARMIGAVQISRSQKAGTPISASRTDPPPTPVRSAKKATVTKVCFSRAPISAPDRANTAMPPRSSSGGRAGVSGKIIFALYSHERG